MYKKYTKSWFKHIDFILVDMVSLHIAYILAYWLRFKTWELPYTVDNYREIAVAMTLVNILVAVLFKSFSGVLKRNHNRELFETLKHVVLVMGVLMLYMFLQQNSVGYSRFTIFVTMGMYAFFSYGFRMAYKISRREKLLPKRSFLIITTKAQAEEAVLGISKAANNGIRINGLILTDVEETGKKYAKVEVVADRKTAVEYICRQWTDEVFVDLPVENEDVKQLIKELTEMGVTVHLNLAEMAKVLGQNYMVETMGAYTVITSSINFVTPLQMFVKRVVDIIGSLVGCVFTLLLTIFLAPFILVQSPGPLFFKQERIGLNGKRFKMIKFRSMYMDAEERKKELMAQNKVSDGMMFKLDWDPRIIGNKELPDGTRKSGIGEFIRKTSLDEFPQFLNVLKGDMSLVGTRPPTADEWEKYQLHHRARLAVKPGITGMWQVSGRSNITDFEEVVRLDTEYIGNWSLWLDLKILVKTVGAVLKHKGAM